MYAYENSSEYSYQRKHSPRAPVSPKWGFCEPECGQLSAVLAYGVRPHARDALQKEQPSPVQTVPSLTEQPSVLRHQCPVILTSALTGALPKELNPSRPGRLLSCALSHCPLTPSPFPSFPLPSEFPE